MPYIVAMKNLLTLLLLFSVACSKKADPAAADPNADPIPAGQHVIRAVITGTGWDARDVAIGINRTTARTGERAIYRSVNGTWQQARGDKALRLAYRDTAATLQFSCHMSPTLPNGLPMPAGATLTCKVYVDNRYQDQVQLVGTGQSANNYEEYSVITNALK